MIENGKGMYKINQSINQLIKWKQNKYKYSARYFLLYDVIIF